MGFADLISPYLKDIFGPGAGVVIGDIVENFDFKKASLLF